MVHLGYNPVHFPGSRFVLSIQGFLLWMYQLISDFLVEVASPDLRMHAKYVLFRYIPSHCV